MERHGWRECCVWVDSEDAGYVWNVHTETALDQPENNADGEREVVRRTMHASETSGATKGPFETTTRTGTIH